MWSRALGSVEIGGEDSRGSWRIVTGKNLVTTSVHSDPEPDSFFFASGPQDAQVVLLLGNHESARILASGPPWQRHGVEVCRLACDSGSRQSRCSRSSSDLTAERMAQIQAARNAVTVRVVAIAAATSGFQQPVTPIRLVSW